MTRLEDPVRSELAEIHRRLGKLLALPEGETPAESLAPAPANTPPAPPSRPAAEKPGPPADIRYYKVAAGYYVDSKLFKVLKGSRAKGYTSHTFDGLPAASLRQRLIERGILAWDKEWGEYVFQQDYTFHSPSTAACIIDGNSRSGTVAWGRP